MVRGIPKVNGSRETIESRDGEIERRTHTAFVDNLPTDVTKEWLWDVFGSIGRVLDVYLSFKIRVINPLRFAFVRFGTSKEVKTAIEQYDGWIVWGCQLKISELRFRRTAVDRRRKDNQRMQENGGEMANGHKEEKSNQHNLEVGRSSGRSYKDVLVQDLVTLEPTRAIGDSTMQSLGESKIKLMKDSKVTEVLQRCLIGESLELFDFPKLAESLKRDCQSIVRVKSLGSFKVVMEFETEQQMKEVLDSQLLLNHFMEIRKWSEGETNRTRRTWLEIPGLPLHAWNYDNMIKIGRVWGRVIRLENEAVDHFNEFKVLIDTGAGVTMMIYAHNSPDTVVEADNEIGEKVVNGNEEMMGDSPAMDAGDPSEKEAKESSETLGLGEDSSPTKTKSLEDDRRTEDVIRERQRLNERDEFGPHDTDGSDCNGPFTCTDTGLNLELEFSSDDAPPGFQNRVLKLNTTLKKGKGKRVERKHGENHQKKRTTIRVRGCLVDRKRRRGRKKLGKRQRDICDDGSLEEIEDDLSDEEDDDVVFRVSEAWKTTGESGMAAMDEEGALEFLKAKAFDSSKAQNTASRRTRGRKKKCLLEVGGSIFGNK
ncbi:hypothetical protein PIB30_022215 [Stylosanthes scabra]|uniref:RRM domain-containing protein n=1 Tax=Stylosanthes scabra TaxID=79078 RepID=A0ABU6Y961_9FABA|nr:hypothetical protein [Stylosanthes scabra]